MKIKASEIYDLKQVINIYMTNHLIKDNMISLKINYLFKSIINIFK